MKSVSIFSLVIGLAWPLVGASQTQVWTEDDWTPLTNEPSRQDLLRFDMGLDLEILSIPRVFKFPDDTLDVSNGPRTYGIDISHYTSSELPFDKFAQRNIRYVYIKATQGVSNNDPKFKFFWNAIGELSGNKKVARGAYHFLSASTASDPVTQADRFVAYVNLQGGFKNDDLPPVLDLEWDKATAKGKDRWRKLTPTEIVDKALAFLKRVEQLTGKIPMIYTSKAWWRERGIADAKITKLARYKLWIADYSSATLASENPTGPNGVVPELWQFTDKAAISSGSTGSFDGDVFKGTLQEFMQEFLGM